MARDGRSQPPGLGLPCSMSKSDPPVQPMQHSCLVHLDQLGFRFGVGHPLAGPEAAAERQEDGTKKREGDVGSNQPAASLIFKVMDQYLVASSLLIPLTGAAACASFFAVLRHPPPLACVSQRLLESWLAPRRWCLVLSFTV
ncbi:uncharacterized protein ARB_07092 [Trichophyton benhamiae CBS 112371]|uniref:Uncharacterized protein n=1 Tax=Arthroderma benhamiae (strain ATCC MYA-4681 / CBS 112371) TaxID=663331 RepID=D4AS77_ARTBC|nr:uncharacterized protein ARB_07092 [Trichophyton benhamiae CBS 112371]EFE34141.1 hypothetical protein ARB_07092 [Trichophyton benhamiae CBS 112371]